MTNDEWTRFTKRLFIEYPSLWDRLQRAPSPVETLAHWQRKLDRYTLDELNAVLDVWDKGNVRPWDSYALEAAPAIIASVCDKNRESLMRKEQSNKIREAGRNPRKQRYDGERVAFSAIKGEMKVAYEKLRPIHQRFLNGEITESDYNETKAMILGELG
jgi:hypothetical protein